MARPKPFLLVILDGFGVSLETIGNPVAAAQKPAMEGFERDFPYTTLQASGVAVGLPWGEAGNSEVGHLTMGAGRVLHHHLPRIIHAIRDGSFFDNPALSAVAEHVKKNGSRLHVAGLVSSGSVHSYADHLEALVEWAGRAGIGEVLIHVFTDGKDAPPRQGADFLKGLAGRLAALHPGARYASVSGRFYAMDRDEKWDRVQKAYALMTEGTGERIASVPEYLRASYARGIDDGFIEPAIVLEGGGNQPPTTDHRPPTIQEHDAVIFLNFREDSMRELVHAFADDDFRGFPRKKVPDLFVATMTEYEKNLAGAMPLFPAADIQRPLGKVLSDAGLRQLRIAETEKYAHVTYFFNGGDERPLPLEDRMLVASAPVAHFDEAPEMRAAEITAKIIEHMGTYDVVIANFANADMVGHSGNFSAAVRAVQALDAALGTLSEAVLAAGGVMVITADHGNIELKRSAVSGEKLTEHSINPVPMMLIGEQYRRQHPRAPEEIRRAKSEVNGILTDVAPTILALLGIEKPAEMTGQDLLPRLLSL